MANLTPDSPPREVHVGDKGRRLSYVFQDATRLAARILTGYAAWITFWYPDSAPHVIRAAKVDGANGKPVYELLGDEYTVSGKDLLAQFTVMDPTTGLRTSSEIIKLRVMRKPS